MSTKAQNRGMWIFGGLLVVAASVAMIGCSFEESVPSNILQEAERPFPEPVKETPPATVIAVTPTPSAVLAVRPQTSQTIRPVNDWSLGRTAADSLSRLGPGAVPELVQMLDSRNEEVRLRAARVLTRMGPDSVSATEPLLLIAENVREPADLRKAAVRALGQIGEAIWPVAPVQPPLPQVSLEPPTRIDPLDPNAEISPEVLELENEAAAQRRQLERTAQLQRAAYAAEEAEYQRKLEIARRVVNVLAQLSQTTEGV